jgi:hypothetical protein
MHLHAMTSCGLTHPSLPAHPHTHTPPPPLPPPPHLHTHATHPFQWEGRKLTEVINTEHENPKYLPGVRLPDNVVAVPGLEEAARDASVLVLVLPHQFLAKRARVARDVPCAMCSVLDCSRYGVQPFIFFPNHTQCCRRCGPAYGRGHWPYRSSRSVLETNPQRFANPYPLVIPNTHTHTALGNQHTGLGV